MSANKHDSPYTCIVFFLSGSPLKYKYVRNVVALSLWLNKNYSSWLYINIYNRKSGKYLSRATKGAFIVACPDL